MTTLDYALAYIKRGFSVLPLKPRSKAPAINIAEFLSGERRLTADDTLQWWGDHLDEAHRYGIAIVCGSPSGGLVVVDVDPRNGGDYISVIDEIPGTPAVWTGGGGMHFYCQGAGLVPKGKTSRPGVDRQGEGSYVVAPPSVHPSGQPYKWSAESANSPLQPLPAWVLERPGVTERRQSGESPNGDTEISGKWISEALATPEMIRPGTQEETLTRLAWWAAGTLDQDIAAAVLDAWVLRLPTGNPSDPWNEAHVKAKLDAAYAKRGQEFTVQSPPASSLAAEPTDEVAEIEGAIVRAEDYAVTAREDWIVEHLAAPGCFTEILGEVKKGKSTFNSQMIRCVLEGRDFLGWRVRRTGVVLYSEQVGLSLDATLERAGVRRHEGLHILDQSKTFGKRWSAVVTALLRRCQAVGAQLLFVDTLTRLAGVEGEAENASGVVSILDPFRAAKALGIAVVFVRHAGKSRENREDVSRAGRGSTALTGDMDIAVNLYQPGSEDVRRVKTISRLGEDLTVLLRYTGEGYEVVADDVPTTTRGRRGEETREAVEVEFRSGNTTIAGIARALGHDRRTVQRYLAQVTGGLVVESALDSSAELE